MSKAGRARRDTITRSPYTLGQMAGAFSGLLMALLFVWGCARPGTAAPASGAFPPSVSSVPQPSSAPLPVASNDIRWGNPQAPVTIVAFLDFECPFCARAHGTLSEVLDAYGPEQLRLVVKHAPLPFHKRGLKAASATQAVYELAGGEVFLAYVRRLFEEPDNLSDSALAGWARELGVAPESYQSALTSERVQAKVRADLELAERVGVNGVPAFYINGASIVGAMPKADFVAIIDHELRASQELLRRGVAPGAVFAERVGVNWAAPDSVAAPYEQVAYRVPIGTSPSIGPANAAVTIVEFADFECPFCQRAHETISTLMANHPGQIRWVMKHNPLPFHPLAVPAAVTALEIRRHKGDAEYWEALEKLYAAPKLSDELLNQVAAEYGIEVTTAERALDASELPPQLYADQDLAMDLDAQGTPHFFVNGRRLAGAQPLAVFEALVGEELRNAAALGGVEDPYAALQRTALPPSGLAKREVPPPPSTSPSLGAAIAPVVIQMFADFECAYCARALPTLAALRARYPGKIKLVWRHLPLPFHKHAKRAAFAAIEAQAQLGPAAFWRMAERLMGVPDAFADTARTPLRPVGVELNGETLTQAARELGLNQARFEQALEQGVHAAVVEADEEAARVLGVHGTPAFFVGPYAVEGAQPLARFDRLVRLVLEESQQD